MKKLLHLLQSQVGYSEHAGGSTKFGHWYDSVENDADYTSQPWCDMFLSWGAHKLGYAHWFGQFAYTVGHARWFKQHHAWGSVPVPGAVVFFDWAGTGTIDGIDHVGIVASVDGKKIHTIEGNTGGGEVLEQVRDQSSVVGYGYPDKIKTRQDVKVEQEARAVAAATAHQTMSLPPAAPRPAATPSPAPTTHHLSRASQATSAQTELSAAPALSTDSLAGGTPATVQAEVTGTAPGTWTAAHSDPDAKTVSRTTTHTGSLTGSHTVPAAVYEPASTRTVADFQPLPSIPPQLGETAVITPLLVAVLAAAYFKMRRGSVRHAVADGDAQAVVDSPAPSRAPGHGEAGEPGGWFIPARTYAVADRANLSARPPWTAAPVDRPATPPPPSQEQPDQSATSDQPSRSRPSLYQGSDGLADALQAFWTTNLGDEIPDGPTIPIPAGTPAPVEQPASAGEPRPEHREVPRARWADGSPAPAERPAPEAERPAPEERPSPVPPRRTKGGRHRKS
ncbi:CHAP domain-containing protein [Planotetraspora kaengkrachanensis]